MTNPSRPPSYPPQPWPAYVPPHGHHYAPPAYPPYPPAVVALPPLPSRTLLRRRVAALWLIGGLFAAGVTIATGGAALVVLVPVTAVIVAAHRRARSREPQHTPR